ncbi:STAS domain-containing protein [Streptomyces sp. NPDC048266]|uniref:STAS domain-containing protein n=1 Tax=unclassified Streptomyces TaxID=2593676 RepID=UPI0033D2727F
MTTSHPDHLRLTTVDAEDRVRIELHGDLDFDNADLLLSEVTALVSGRPHLNDLHLHFGGVGMVDSMGLSVLLMIGRRTAEAGVRLHLEDRPAALDRLLDRTGTRVYFTSSSPGGTAEVSGAAGNRASVYSMGPDEAT